MGRNDGDKLLAQQQQCPLEKEIERDIECSTNRETLEYLQDFVRQTSSDETENEFPATAAPVRDEIDNGDKANAKSGVEESKTNAEPQKVRDSQNSVGEGDGGSAYAGDEVQGIAGGNDSAESVEKRDLATKEVEAISSSENGTHIIEPQNEISQDNSLEGTGGSVIRDTALSSQIPSDGEQDPHLETTAAHTPDETNNREDNEAESENESGSDKNFEDDILWRDDFDSQPNHTPEKKDPQEPDFIKMMAERELELVQKKLEEEATEEAIKQLARQDFGDNVPDPDQALIEDQEEIYKMIQMDLEASKSGRSGQTDGDVSSAPRDPGSVEGGDIQQSEVGVESSVEQADEQASGLVTQPSGHDQTQSDTANESRQVAASSVPDRADDLDEETESVTGASKASVSDSTIYGEGHLIKPTIEKGTRPIDNMIDQEQLEFAVKVMGEDTEKLKLGEEEFFKKREEEGKRKASEDSSSKASSSQAGDSEKDEDDQDHDGSRDDSPPDGSPPDDSPLDDSPPNNCPSDRSQDHHEDPSQKGTPKDTQDGNQHQPSQSGDSSNGVQDNDIAEGDHSQKDAPQTLISSDKKSNNLPPVLKLTPKATIPQLISEFKEWALLALSCLDSKDFPGGGLRNVVQSLVNFGEAILRICDEKDGRGTGGGEVGGVDINSLIDTLTASKLAGDDIEQANWVSQQAEVEDSGDDDSDIPKLIPDSSLRKSTDDQEAVSKNKADPSVDVEEIVDLGPRNEEQTNPTESSSSDRETKEDVATIAEKVLHWAYEGFEKEYFCRRPGYNNYTNRLAEDLWKRQNQLRMAEADFEAEKARLRVREFDMIEIQEKQKERNEKDEELKKREDDVKVRESVVDEIEMLLIERDTKLLEREQRMHRIERKLKEGKKDEDGEGEGEGGDCEKKKCESQ